MSEPVSEGAKRWRVIVILLGIFLIVLAATVSLKITSRSDFCGTCHEMQPQYTAWAQSPHQDVDCVTCHVEPGIVNLVKHKAGAVKQVYEHVSGNVPENIVLPGGLPQETCLECHENPSSKIDGMWGMTHQEHIDRGTPCSTCHRDSVHVVNPQTNFKACANCHETPR